ncbi:MAG: DUF4097 family beta strand repeat protein [Lachnospiraceae bacterium]|nr:DUF4097 family beta strand repeat protein [Lachnospiraceae bacterium]
MRKGYKVLVIIGICLIAAGLTISIITLAINGFRVNRLLPTNPEESEINRIEQTITEKVDNIKIEAVEDNVILMKADDGVFRVLYAERANVKYTFSVTNGTLKLSRNDVDWSRPGNWLSNLIENIQDGLYGATRDIIIYLPETSYKTLELTSVSGNIVLEENFSFVNAALTDVSGNITLRGINPTGTLAIATTSGNIFIENVNSGMTTFAAVSGAVTLKNSVFESITGSTVSGEVVLEYIEAENLDFETTSGDVTGRVREAQDFHCETTSGEISVPTGGTNPWYIETVSGDINITK